MVVKGLNIVRVKVINAWPRSIIGRRFFVG
jgi:hypothetical protein